MYMYIDSIILWCNTGNRVYSYTVNYKVELCWEIRMAGKTGVNMIIYVICNTVTINNIIIIIIIIML